MQATTGRSRIEFPRGFTLLELLLVIGLVAFLIGGLGVALRDRTRPQIAQAQQAIAALCSAARTQAVLHQVETRVCVLGGSSTETNHTTAALRLLQVYRQNFSPDDQWIPAGAPLVLPADVFVLVGNEDVMRDGGSSATLASTLLPHEQGAFPVGSRFRDAARVWFIGFEPDGTLSSVHSGLVQIVVGAGAWHDRRLRVSAPEAARIVAVRANGSIAFRNVTQEF